MKAGVAIKPDTPADVLFPLLDREKDDAYPDVCILKTFYTLSTLESTLSTSDLDKG